MKTLIRFTCMPLGALLILGALLTLFVPEDFDVVPVDIAAIEADASSLPDQVRITGGRLYWPAATESVKEHLRTKETTSNGWFVPLISEALLATFDAAESEGRPAPVELCRVIAQLPPDAFDAFLKGAPPGLGAESESNAQPFELTGTAKPGRALPLHVKRGLEEAGSPLQIDRLVYVEHGSDVAAWQAGLGLALFGALLLGFGHRRLR